MDFDRDAYLERIDLDRSIALSEESLAAVHRAQTFSIPFENFDIHLGRGVSLEPEVLFDKLVNHQRGGYCFELNSLFGMALDAFGFTRRPLLARSQRRGAPTSRTHMLNLVSIGGREWIADPGFGPIQLRTPLPLELDRIETQDGVDFRIVNGEKFGMMLQYREGGDWRNWYSFDMEHVFPVDIEMGNYFTSTHPDIYFTQVRVAVRTVPFGKTTLMDFLLRNYAGGQVEEIIIDPGPPYLEALKEHFGIVIDVPYDALKPVRDDAGQD